MTTDSPPARSITAAFEAEVVDVRDLGPSFRRITLGGRGMHDFGIGHHPRDQRFKLIIPPGGGDPVFDLVSFLADQSVRGVSWYQAWLQVDHALRGSIRTYTVREWRDERRELVVDMVVHADEHGRSGPASTWATHARIGSRLHLIGPSRRGEPSLAAIGFRPGRAHRFLFAGDETAVPAVASILDHLAESDVVGTALLEVPTADDVQELRTPERMTVIWLPRDGAPSGARLNEAFRRCVAGAPPLSPHAPAGVSYAWLAGEAEGVKMLRRHLVRDIGFDRDAISFTGYWRHGRAEGA